MKILLLLRYYSNQQEGDKINHAKYTLICSTEFILSLTAYVSVKYGFVTNLKWGLFRPFHPKICQICKRNLKVGTKVDQNTQF